MAILASERSTPPTLFAHVERKALGVVRIGGQPVEALPLHAATAPAVTPTEIELEIDAQIAAGQVPHAARPPVVPGARGPATRTADRFLGRRVSGMTRACGSPKIPRIVRLGVKPGTRSASRRSRWGEGRKGMHELHVLAWLQQVPVSPLTATA